MILRNIHVDVKYKQIVRQVSYLTLYRLYKTNSQKVEINGILEDKIISKDWETVFINRTKTTEMVDGIDPIKENFNSVFEEALRLELINIKKRKIIEARKLRWDFIENKIFKNKTFSNISAERNTSLLFQALYNYKKNDITIRWSNLDGSYVEINESNVSDLESLYHEICIFHQLSFDAVNKLIEKITLYNIADKIMCLDLKKEWDNAILELGIGGHDEI